MKRVLNKVKVATVAAVLAPLLFGLFCPYSTVAATQISENG